MVPRNDNVEFLSAGMVDVDLSLLIMLVLFLVFAFLLHALVLKPLIAAQEKRFASMGGAREGASEAELKAAERRLEYESRLTKARQDAVVVRDQIKTDAERQAASTLEQIGAETTRAVQAGQAALAETAAKARSDMKGHVDQLSTELAARLLGGKA
ncbi:MAG: ATP synthase F0 subunit B [Deltaproteobacteria bacterium]|nr:ATP synthase F0 subunit B [Deltaproteobacteria bacterium]